MCLLLFIYVSVHSAGENFRVNTGRNPRALVLRRQRKARKELPLSQIVTRFCMFLDVLEVFLHLRPLRTAVLQ